MELLDVPITIPREKRCRAIKGKCKVNFGQPLFRFFVC
jgi:hypothetical protein